jgi:hypothetical protein
MSAEEKNKFNLEIIKFSLYVISLVITVVLAYGALDKRVTILETEMQHKVDYEKLFQKLDLVKEDLAKKIEDEMRKVNQQNEQFKKRENNGK